MRRQGRCPVPGIFARPVLFRLPLSMWRCKAHEAETQMSRDDLPAFEAIGTWLAIVCGPAVGLVQRPFLKYRLRTFWLISVARDRQIGTIITEREASTWGAWRWAGEPVAFKNQRMGQGRALAATTGQARPLIPAGAGHAIRRAHARPIAVNADRPLMQRTSDEGQE